MAKEEIILTSYDESNIKHLDDMTHIRKRSGMYIGGLGDGSNQSDGIYVLLKEIIDNTIDEFTMHAGNKVIINITEEGEVSVRDFGRGIPLGSLAVVLSKLNTGGKYDSKAFKKSVGLNGVGTKAVNALSQYFYAESYRDGYMASVSFERGQLIEQISADQMVTTKEKNGTFIKFLPDEQVFGKFKFNMNYVISMIKNYSYLNKGLTLILNGESYVSKNGLLDVINDNLSREPIYPPIHLEGEDIEFVITHGDASGESIASYVNGQNTREGGTHLAAFREAVAKTLKEFFKKEYAPEDVREGLIGAISIRIQEPNFSGQAKTKLSSTYTYEQEAVDSNGEKIKDENGAIKIERGQTIRAFINDFVKTNLDNYLHINKELVPIIKSKIEANEKVRKEINEVKKANKERSKRSTIYNKKLRDCKIHLGDRVTEANKNLIEKTSIFITEGDSASGTITKARNSQTQAVFSLRGKPINCYKESARKVAENEELTLLINALGMENSSDDLRYNNIVIATDADDDGMHIRMLIVTFFMKYYPEIIRQGHLYILQTPLFRVRNKKEVRYCYNKKERDAATKALKTGIETTRFKGLGEISSNEFKDFIGEKMRLDQVSLEEGESMSELMEFYMGENFTERQEFIMGNLRSAEELEDVNI